MAACRLDAALWRTFSSSIDADAAGGATSALRPWVLGASLVFHNISGERSNLRISGIDPIPKKLMHRPLLEKAGDPESSVQCTPELPEVLEAAVVDRVP